MKKPMTVIHKSLRVRVANECSVPTVSRGGEDVDQNGRFENPSQFWQEDRFRSGSAPVKLVLCKHRLGMTAEEGRRPCAILERRSIFRSPVSQEFDFTLADGRISPTRNRLHGRRPSDKHKL